MKKTNKYLDLEPRRGQYISICNKRDILWMNVPKNGSTSMSRFLTNTDIGFCSKLIQYDGPWTNNGNRSGWTQDEFEKRALKCMKLIITRNPFARIVSTWKMFNNKEDGRSKTFWSNYKRITGNDINYLKFEDFCDNLEIFLKFEPHLQKQVDFLFYPPDLVLRLEEINSCIKKLCKKINLTGDVSSSFPRLNSKKYRHYSNYYNDETKKIVEHIYKDDLNNFNYVF